MTCIFSSKQWQWHMCYSYCMQDQGYTACICRIHVSLVLLGLYLWKHCFSFQTWHCFRDQQIHTHHFHRYTHTESDNHLISTFTSFILLSWHRFVTEICFFIRNDCLWVPSYVCKNIICSQIVNSCNYFCKTLYIHCLAGMECSYAVYLSVIWGCGCISPSHLKMIALDKSIC